MTNTYIKTLKEHRIKAFVFATVFFSMSIAVGNARPSESLHSAASDGSGTLLDCCADESGSYLTYVEEATKLHERLTSSGSFNPNIKTLAKALERKQQLLASSVTISIVDPDHEEATPAKWMVSIAKYPELLTFNHTWVTAGYSVDEEKLAELIDANAFPHELRYSTAVISKTELDNKNVLRAVGTPVARDGYDYDARDVASLIASALQDGKTEVEFTATYRKGTLDVVTDAGATRLDLLSTGVSDYSYSPEARVWNVHKAIDERVNNIIVKPGQIFSFVDSLNAPVTTQKGWKEALGLFGGGAAMTPGAGICQAATTVFRAALLAGLPIVERRMHSMWVDHYESFGAGVDATIFPGVHDMRFRNDTGSDIVIQAYIEGDLVYVNFYGKKDDRTVNLDGPYFYNTTPRNKDLPYLGKDQTGWIYEVTKADGSVTQQKFVSTYYKGMPRFVFEQYAGLPGEKLLTDPSLSLTVRQKVDQGIIKPIEH